MWTSDIPSIVLTKVKYGFSEKIKRKYPDINFTTKKFSKINTMFPTVYINKLSSPEIGQTLDGLEINAIFANFQIEITDNVSERRVIEVADEVLRIMKTMRFEIAGDPYSDSDESAYRYIMRCRRVIGASDIL